MTVDSPPTAAREPVGLANSNEIMKTPLCTERYYTSPNRVRPPGAEIEQDIDLATSFWNPEFSQTAAIELVLVRGASINYYTSPDRV
jgi:hypothetical protein